MEKHVKHAKIQEKCKKYGKIQNGIAWKSDISRNEKMEEKLKNGEKRARNGGIDKK